MNRRIILPALILSVLAIVSAGAADRFEPAEDLPGGAVIFAETGDLGRLIEIWGGSVTADRYLQSRNFREFSNRRLGLRLAARWREFSDGIGSEIGSSFLRSLSKRQAALAVYDVGELELVFIAPLSRAAFEASLLFGLKGTFEESQTEKGTAFYSKEFEVDNGRRDQKVFFGQIAGRLVIATDEKLFAATETNLLESASRSKLSQDAAFGLLRDTDPRAFVTVWIDQRALNGDYYFRRYWLGKKVSELAGYRSGRFTLKIEKDRIVEERQYLLTRTKSPRILSARQLRELRGFVPMNATFYRIQTADRLSAGREILGSLFAEQVTSRAREEGLQLFRSEESFYDDYIYSGFYGLDERFEKRIDESEEDGGPPRAGNRTSELKKIVDMLGGGALSLLSVRDPVSLEFPLFADARRGGAVSVPAGFNESAFRAAIVSIASHQVGAADQTLKLEWSQGSSGEARWQCLELPFVGREFCYVRSGGYLLFANSGELMAEMLSQGSEESTDGVAAGLSEYSALNISVGKEDLEGIFSRLNPDAKEDDFFKGNVASLLGSLSELGTITVETRPGPRILKKKITFRRSPE